MSAAKHSIGPGPWVVHPASYEDRAYIVPIEHADRPIGGSSDMDHDRDDYAQQICTLNEDAHGRRDTLKHARLIAAAPELLEACRNALYALKGREHDQFLRDAIAKAQGGTQ